MDISRLIDMSIRYSSEEAADSQRLPDLSIYRRDTLSEIEAFIYKPAICLILQGSKVTSIGDQVVEVWPGDALLISHDLPVVSRIIKASVQEPYLAVILSLDLALVGSLYAQIGNAPAPDACARSLTSGPADPIWLAPLFRYLELARNTLDAKVLGPSVRLEIHYRLLTSPNGNALRTLLSTDSHASRVAKAIQRIRVDFRSSLSVPDLAKSVGMSASSFHQHFKWVTGTTPLQYQKDLRLIEARALLMGRKHSVSEVAYSVGYESPTHFSRDYSKKFGLPPSKSE